MKPGTPTPGPAPDNNAGMSASGRQAQPRPDSANPQKPPRVKGRKIRTLEQRIEIGRSDAALHLAPGHVVLTQLDSHDWKRQLSDFIHAYGRESQRGSKECVSEETFRNRQDHMFSTVRDLMMDRSLRHMKTLGDCKPRMLFKMFEIWTDRGVGKRAQINYFNTWRWFWRATGIEIKDISYYATVEGEFTINRAATEDKSWTAKGIKFEEIALQMETLDPIAARVLRLMAGFGLRLKEGLRIQPNEADGGDRLNVTQGTKSGRPREIIFEELSDGSYRAMLDDAKATVSPKCHAAWEKRTLKQAKQRMYNLARKLGLTRGRLGITLHGLRHQFAIDQLEAQTGAIAPVRGGRFKMLDYKQLVGARLKISRALGHNRIQVTTAYYGSFSALANQQLRNFEGSWTLLSKALRPLAGKVLSTDSVDNLYWLGARAEGLSMDKNVPFHLVFALGAAGKEVLDLRNDIASSVKAALGVECIVQLWAEMSESDRNKWENLAVPIFKSESPVQKFREKVAHLKSQSLRAENADDDEARSRE